ncbi:MAG: histidine phosphatase family protein [Deltaproteobacteria bacterium]|nr:histidine phosphatase family protein [Deltaproteobacteria bacterium]MBW2399069.1 histidine phosphatase family protein [Deltaproteobacteria bacterium]
MDDLRFVLIRHGETPWNAAGRWQGHSDPSLSAVGREQAARLAGELTGEPIDAIIASDLRRAFETATILGDAIGLRPECDARLRELDVGRWGGETRDQIRLREPEALGYFDTGSPDARAAEGETRRELAARVHAAVADIAARTSVACIALVVHSGVVRALLPGTQLENGEWKIANFSEIEANASNLDEVRGAGLL